MSESAPEAPAKGKKDNVFTRKIGPLPMWVWVAIVGAVILGWALYKSKTSAASSATPADTTDASQVPQFVNQTYTNGSPPVAGPPGSTGPAGPAGPSGPTGPSGPVGKGAPKTRTEKLRYKGNLDQIAKRNHVTLAQLLSLNPGLAKYKDTGHVFPVGTTVNV